MKRVLIYIVSFFFMAQVFAQYESAGMPLKYTPEKQGKKRSASSFFINLNADTTKISFDTPRREYISGVTCPVDISMNEGNTFVEGNVKVWRVGLNSENAKGISLFFDKFLLPEGGKLFVYNPDQTIIYGAFTSANNNEENKLLIRPLAADSIIVEYQEPFEAPFEAELHLSLATHELRRVNAFMVSNECTPVVSNQQGTEKIKQSVCLLYMVGSTSSYWGSGSLINNAEHKPYIFTAGHNLKTADLATRTIYYFNYQVPAVDANFQGSRQFTISGSTLISRDEKVDFALAELYKMPPADYRPYLAGWTRETPKAPYVCIQHPSGDIKKISTTDEISVSYFDTPRIRTYWWVKRWTEGVTQKGSSGSPLFDADGRIIGNLTGGNSKCDSPVDDYFCQVSAAWNYYSDDTKQLASHLDPKGTDVMSMDGYDPYAALQVERISNVKVGDKVTNYIVNDTPLIGHTYDGFTKFAEKFELKEPATVYGVYMMPFWGRYNSSMPITIEIYSGQEEPEQLLASTVVHPTEANFYRSGTYFEEDIVDLDMQEIYVPLERPTVVTKNLFVVVNITYDNLTEDDIVSLLSVMGGSKCTAYFYYEGWVPFNEYLVSGQNLSIWIDPVVGKANVTDIEEVGYAQLSYSVYPNPTRGKIVVTPSFDGEYKLFDMTGKMVDAGVYNNQIDISGKGFYLLELLSNTGKKETHKIICH